MSQLTAQLWSPELEPRGPLPIFGGKLYMRNCHVSGFLLDVDTTSELWSRIQADYGDLRGWHVRIFDDGVQVMSGRFTDDEVAQRLAEEGTLIGVCHLDLVDTIFTLPSPGRAADDQTVTGYYTASGPAGQLIHDLVRTHVGQDARTENKTPIVSVPAAIGSQRSVRTRFKELLEEIQQIAKAGGTLFTAAMDKTGQITFTQSLPRDLTRAVRLSTDNGSLAGYMAARSRPTATRALVAGQGEGAARTLVLVEGNSPNPWGYKRMIFLDQRHTDDQAELLKAGQDALLEAAEKTTATLELRDMPGARFGTDYGLGDQVTVDLGAGMRLETAVQAVELTYTASGRSGTITVGEFGAEPERDPLVEKLHAELAEAKTRLRNLEVR